MGDAVDFMIEAADTLRDRCVFLSRLSRSNTRLMVMPDLLDNEPPLIAQVDLAHGLGPPWAINLARAWVALLGRAVVLDSAAIAYKVVARRLTIAVVAGA